MTLARHIDEISPCVHVLFAEAVISGVPLWTRVRFARRYPLMAYASLLAWLTRALTRSKLAHCAVMSRGVVLDPAIGGDQLWKAEEFFARYPTLREVVAVTVPADIAIPQLDPWGRRRALPSIFRLITRGRVRTRDCVERVAHVLRLCGLTVPTNIVSPQQLHDWLVQQGCPHESI